MEVRTFTDKFHPELQKVLSKMCDYVQADPRDIDFQSHDWYMQYRWSPEKETEFKKWLTHHLMYDRNARKVIMGMSYYVRKTEVERHVDMYLICMMK